MGEELSAGAARAIEDGSLRAWPALETERLDGWELRASAGVTKRANSVQPLGPSRLPLADKVARCEEWYGARGLPTIFRLTPFSDHGLDALLKHRGYAFLDRCAVLQRATSPIPGAPADQALVETTLAEWLPVYGRLSGMPDGRTPAALARILGGVRGDRLLGVLMGPDGAPAACGVAIRDGDLVGLFDIVTDPARRRRGFATALIDGLLRWGSARGASRAYLQVVRGNDAACALYATLGFATAYDYWYRVAPSPV